MSDEDIDSGGAGAPLSEQAAADTPADDVVTAGADDAGGGGEDAAIEAEAREMGWVPESEWKGDKKPAKFYSAAEFVERGQTILPIVRKRAQEAEAKLAEVDKKWEERFSKMERMNKIALDKQREKLEADFKARKREAVKLGDEEGYDAIEKAEAKALKELDEQGKEPEPEKTQDGALSPSEMSALAEWRAENKWFQSDRKLTALMDAEFAEVSEEMPGATFAQKLEEARSRVAATFPEKFGEKPGKKPGAVESGSRMHGGGARDRLADRLPEEAKKAADKFISEGLFKSREEYAKEYFGEEA